MVHEKDGSPIGYDKICKKEGKSVPNDEIVKAYEVSDGEVVYLTDEDFQAAEEETYKTIEILDFVPRDEIDPIVFHRTYYLGPADGAEKVYALLLKAMESSELSAIARYVFHERQQLGALRIRDGVITLEHMYFADEIRPTTDVVPKKLPRVEKRELDMAETLIERFTLVVRPRAVRGRVPQEAPQDRQAEAEGQGDTRRGAGGARGADRHPRGAQGERRGGEGHAQRARVAPRRHAARAKPKAKARPRVRPRAPRGRRARRTRAPRRAWLRGRPAARRPPRAPRASAPRRRTSGRPATSPGNIHCGCGVTRSFPAATENSRNSSVITAQTTWKPRSAPAVWQSRRGSSPSRDRRSRARARRRGRSRERLRPARDEPAPAAEPGRHQREPHDDQDEQCGPDAADPPVLLEHDEEHRGTTERRPRASTARGTARRSRRSGSRRARTPHRSAAA